jgi:hypothetical protein
MRAFIRASRQPHVYPLACLFSENDIYLGQTLRKLVFMRLSLCPSCRPIRVITDSFVHPTIERCISHGYPTHQAYTAQAR